MTDGSRLVAKLIATTAPLWNLTPPPRDDGGGSILADLHDGHAVAEEEEWHIVGEIPADYLREHAEGRVVDNDAVVGVLGVLVVATGIERPEDTLACHVGDGADIFDHGVVDILGRVAVVGGLGLLGEFGHEAGIVTEDDGVAGAVDMHLARLLQGLGIAEEGHLCHTVCPSLAWMAAWQSRQIASRLERSQA